MSEDRDKFVKVEEDFEFGMFFFSCSLCPLTLPFLQARTAWVYSAGHVLNKYHQRRLSLLDPH
jgi:hypothetical protein